MTRREEMLQLIQAAEVAGVGIIYGITSRGRDFSTEIRHIPHEGLTHVKYILGTAYDDGLFLIGTTISITDFNFLGREEYESQAKILRSDAEGCREPR